MQNKDAKYPVVGFYLVLITSAIDAHERKDMAVVGIPGELITTDIDRYFIVLLQGILAKLMVKNEPSIY